MHINNVVHLIGYLSKNPEHKSVKASDRKYAVISLATQRSWKGADEEWHSKTEWHRVVGIWNLVCTSNRNCRPTRLVSWRIS
jgi:single-stranded DNA-binding protein